MKIGISAGHQNIKDNCNLNLRGGTGAPGEADWTPKMRDALAGKLIARSFQVILFDANANCQQEAYQDFDLFLAIHYDADIYGVGGGLAGAPSPEEDAVNARSQELAKKINEVYFPLTGIAYHPERINANITHYYLWSSLTAKTPCVLIECGTNNRDNLPNRVDECSTALAKAICAAFGIPYDAPQPSSDDLTTLQRLVSEAKRILYGKGWPWSKISQLKQLLPK